MVSEAENGLLDPLQTARRLLGNTKSRLRWKYFRIFVILGGGALLTSGAIDLFFSYQDQRNAVAKIEQARAASAAVMIERFVDQIKQDIHDFAKIPLPNNSVGLAQRRANFLAFLKHVPAVTDIARACSTWWSTWMPPKQSA